MRSGVKVVLSAALLLLLTSSAAYAQATIAGVVRDSSGALLPGVTVEATSPSLTEKIRTVVSDATGQYRIVTLPPGSYTVTFSLTGFKTIKREDVMVSGSGVIPINAELSVGALQETITVSGASPVVDTQTTRREVVVNQETINALPITRNYGGVLYATPGLTVQPGVNNNALMPGMSLFSAHGGISTEGRVFVDGVSVNGPFGQNSVTQFAFDVANAQEMQVLVGGGLGESETGGPIANIIPKSGGNRLAGNFFISGTTSTFQGNNVNDTLRNQGIANPPTVRKNWDGSAGAGGPLLQDRLWFFGNFRTVGIAQVVAAGMGPNRYLADATQWGYAAEPGVETRFTESKLDMSGRLTGQVTPRQRVTFSYQPQYRCLGSTLTTSTDGCRVRGSEWIGAPATSETIAPEAGPGYQDGPVSLTQATYTSPVSSRHLIDAAISRFWYGIIGSGHMPPDAPMGLIGVTESSNIYGRPNSSYRAPYGWGEYDTVSWNWRAAWSYVTGGHSAKLGYQGTEMKYDWVNYTNPSLLRYTFNSAAPATASCVVQNGTRLCPTGVNYSLSEDFENANRAVAHSVFIQDQWTRSRMTLQGALRYDYVYSWAPAEHNGTDQTTRFNSNPVRFARTDSVTGYHDLSPRFGVAYDLFGDGKTAVKASAGRYLSAATADGVYSSQSPAGNFVRTVTNRSWTDSDGDFVVDCDLLSTAAQNNAATGGDVCGALVGANLNFGNLNPNVATVDPDILHGWGVRPYNWRFGGSVQHELYPGVSLEVGYNRRTWGNLQVTYNTLVGPADYDTWTVPVPSNPNLSNSGSTASFVAITPAAANRGVQDFQTKETNVAGEARTAYWHGIDVNGTARLRGNLTVQAGTSTGRGVRNTCALWQARPQFSISNNTAQRLDACDVSEPWITTFRGLASYRIPKADVQVSSTIRSARTTASENASNGSSLSANYQLPNTVVQTLLGRLPAGAQATGTTTVNLLAPSELYPLTRRTEVDIRIAKILRLAGARFDLGVDVYNLFNANATTTYQQTYLFTDNGATWLNPTAILGPRLARFNATVTF
jgi:Carboxypeptidase regulatory-like domain